ELVCVEGREVVAEAEGAVLVAFAPQQGEELLRHAAVTVPLGGMAHLVARGKPDAVRAALTASHSSLDAIRHVKPGACVCRHANVGGPGGSFPASRTNPAAIPSPAAIRMNRTACALRQR